MDARRNGFWRLLNQPIEVSPKQRRLVRKGSAAALLLLVIVLAYGAGCFDSTRTRINEWLKFHQLAPLPRSATGLMYYQWNGLFTGETYMKVQLSSNELASFVENSTGLLEGKKETFSEHHQHLPYLQGNDRFQSEHSYFFRHDKFPDWYDPAITNRGEMYILQRGPRSQVIINWETSTIFLRSIKG